MSQGQFFLRDLENEKMYASGVSDGFKHAAVALHSILRKDTEQKKIIIKACVENL